MMKFANMTYAPFDIHRSLFSVQHSKGECRITNKERGMMKFANMTYAPFDIQHSLFNIHHSKEGNVELRTRNAE
ncbi:MAG: hypothetical protein AAF849_23295 [Bacteroidota bacterium]